VHPVLFRVGSLDISTYGVTLGLAFFFGLLLGTVRAKRDGMPVDTAWDLGIIAILCGVVGARLEYVRTHPERLIEDPTRVFALRDGGLVFYGGFIGTMLGFALYARLKRARFFDLTDVMAPSLGFGHALGRVGCLAVGCCYGRPTDGPWAITFPEGAVAPAGIPLIPTQVHEIVANFVIGLFLWKLPQGFSGRRTALVLGLYGAFRFTNEFFRNDDRGQFLGTVLTNGQATGLVMVALGIAVWAWGSRAPR
jgi:phosphatidylglycerol:prolipoprotein diacylglycerol transferase